MGKAVILSRVSTVNQDLSTQTEECINECHRMGYMDIITIEDKESAVKLDEFERNGLNDLKRTVDNGGIDCVVAYELSRISRRSEVNFSIRNFLQQNKVQLVVMKPYMRVFNADWTVSETANIMYSLFSALAENEGYLRKERTARGRLKGQQGIKVTANPYGYKANKHELLEINEVEARVVRTIFELYSLGCYSFRSLGEEISKRGDFPRMTDSKYNKFTWVKKIIDTRYDLGEIGTTYKKLPPIISTELWGKCQYIKEQGRVRPKHSRDVIALGRGLIRNKEGFVLVPEFGRNAYRTKKGTPITLSANALESILLHFAVKYKEAHKQSDWQIAIDEINKRIVIVEKKLKKGQKAINDFKVQDERVEERYIYGKISSEKADKMHREIEGKRLEQIDDNQRYETQLMNLEGELASAYWHLDTPTAPNTDEEKIELIHKTIKEIVVERVVGQKATFSTEIKFNDDSKIKGIFKSGAGHYHFLVNNKEEIVNWIERHEKQHSKKKTYRAADK